MWATPRVSGRPVAEYQGSEKGSPESFDIRIRDPVNPEILTEATEGGRVYPHVCLGASGHRGSEVGDSIC
jgi:hypothetical protein